MSKNAKRSGFTLLELMVALAVGGIALTSVYTIGSSSIEQFERQMDLANMQLASQLALAQIKRDLGRAGLHATPNIALPGQQCAPPRAGLDSPGAASGALAAISRAVPTIRTLGPSNNDGNGFESDDLVLIGNYETNNEYGGISVDLNRRDIWVDEDTHAFRQDFSDWPTATTPGGIATVSALFGPPSGAFRTGRLVRILTAKGERYFDTPVAVTAPGASTDAKLSFGPIPPSCVPDIAGGSVAPVNVMRYTILDATGQQGPSQIGPVGQLVRVEVNPFDKTTEIGQRLVLLDFAVAFKVAFLQSTTGVGAVDQYTPGGTYAPPPATSLAQPERVRAVRIEIANRTRMQDRNFGGTTRSFFDPGLCAPVAPALIGRCFQVLADVPGAARVRTARAEVFLPNIAFEGY